MKILITRPLQDAIELAKLLRSIGCFTLNMPLIEIIPGKDLLLLSKKIAKLRSGDLILFLSKHAVYFANNIIKKKN